MSTIERMSGLSSALGEHLNTAENREREVDPGSQKAFSISGASNGITESKGMQIVNDAYAQINYQASRGDLSYADLNLIGMRASQRLIGVKDNETLERSSRNLEELHERIEERAEQAAEARHQSMKPVETQKGHEAGQPAYQSDPASPTPAANAAEQVVQSTMAGQTDAAQAQGPTQGAASREGNDGAETGRKETVDLRI